MKHSISLRPEDVPSYTLMLKQICVFVLCAEPVFYYIHRALHHGYIYKYVHAVHHEFQSPCSLEALYFHWIEVVCQLTTITTGPWILGCHIYTFLLWEALALSVVVMHHSGYELPLDSFPGTGSMAHFHDYHHKVFNQNFGLLGVLDLWHGTREGWNEHRHRWARHCS